MAQAELRSAGRGIFERGAGPVGASRLSPADPTNETRREEMRAVRLPADHPGIAAGRIGVLLVNLGTPEGTGYWPMRRYLSEFLSDRRVIESPPLIWQPILQGIILTTRPKKSGALYASIWNKRAKRIAAARPSPARRRKSSPPSSRASERHASTGRCATASRRSPSGSS